MNLFKEIEKTFSILGKVFSQEELLKFKNSKTDELYQYHFDVGAWIRNNLLKQKGSRLYDLFTKNNIDNPDDMSFIILVIFHYYVSDNL